MANGLDTVVVIETTDYYVWNCGVQRVS